MKKRILSCLLSVVLLVSLLAGTTMAAARVTLSPQKLTVDGKAIACEKYNIDGSNYFKLRDIAMLLNGTAAQFEVGWDNASQTISITTGKSYTAVGGELQIRGDLSGKAVKSSQKLLINGKVVGNLSVYNIGGNNFFKLRDLGSALGFYVGYDSASNTAIIQSESGSTPTSEDAELYAVYGLSPTFTPYKNPSTNQQHIENLIYSVIEGSWVRSSVLPADCDWVYPYHQTLSTQYVEVFSAFINQEMIPYCKNGQYGFAVYRSESDITPQTLSTQLRTSYLTACKISKQMHDAKKITAKSTQAEIAQLYYEYMSGYGVSVPTNSELANHNGRYDTAYAAFIEKKAACGGRTAATNLLLRLEGIRTTGIYATITNAGKIESAHVMSYVLLDGKAMTMDWSNQLGIFDYSAGLKMKDKYVFVSEKADFESADIALGRRAQTKNPILLRFEETGRDGTNITYKIWVDSMAKINTKASYKLMFGVENNCMEAPPIQGESLAKGSISCPIPIKAATQNNMPVCFFLIPV